MRVVIFCGGLGMRMREYKENVPEPLVPIGHIPILWHVMKYYAHFGHKDFILCVGYRADAIRESFSCNRDSPKLCDVPPPTKQNMELFEKTSANGTSHLLTAVFIPT